MADGSLLGQTERLASLGRLSAGVAHELNTPVQFVSDSVRFIGEGTRDLLGLLATYRQLACQLSADAQAQAADAEAAIDLAYLEANLPSSVARSLEGLDRVVALARSMKEFSAPAPGSPAPLDLKRVVESTLTLSRHAYKYVADLDLQLRDTGPVSGRAGDLRQVLLQLVLDAAQAIEEVVAGTGTKGRLGVRVFRDAHQAVLAVSDSGRGLAPESSRPGWALAWAVVVDQHGGQLGFERAPGQGSTVVLRLPVDSPSK